MTAPTPVPGRADEEVCAIIVERVGERTQTDVFELDPLATAVDPDALAALLGGPDASDDVSVTFAYEGFEVTASGDGTVELSEPDPAAPSAESTTRPSASSTD